MASRLQWDTPEAYSLIKEFNREIVMPINKCSLGGMALLYVHTMKSLEKLNETTGQANQPKGSIKMTYPRQTRTEDPIMPYGLGTAQSRGIHLARIYPENGNLYPSSSIYVGTEREGDLHLGVGVTTMQLQGIVDFLNRLENAGLHVVI